MKKTKIIATIGPSSERKQTIIDMAKAGMNVARLNMSHGTLADHKLHIDTIKEIREELEESIAIMIDTRGPEIRLKKFENGSVEIKDNDTFVITNDDVIGTQQHASVTCSDFYQRVKVGDTVLMCDGLIKMLISEIKDKDVIFKIIVGGKLSDSKSINVPGVDLNLPYLSEADKRDLLFAIENDIDFIAASFVSSKEDVLQIKKFLASHGNTDIDVIAKIESQKGVDNLSEIMTASDGIMVARGDLGVEISYEKLPQLQKEIVKRTREAGKRVIVATEMLESMITNSRPTRAETSDVANAVYDGASAIMLSGETASGKYPVQAVRTMATIAQYTESCIHYKRRFITQDFVIKNIADSISNTAVKASLDLDCKAILVVTESGASARMISRFRPICPIIAITPVPKTYYKLALSWGVIPTMGTNQVSSDELFHHATEISKRFHYIKDGDTVVTVASTYVGKTGHTNLLKIEQVK